MSLSLQNITHHYGKAPAVKDAVLEAAAGEIVCLFGPSGCGKTTLLRLAAGLETLQSGRIALNDEVLAIPGEETPPEQRPIGFVFQDFVLFPHMTVEKNISFGLGGKGRGAKKRVEEQIEAIGLHGLAKRYPHELSGGQQQRTALARALIRRPAALLLDEPFASIDGALRKRLREDLRRMLKEQNAAVVLVTHDPEEALALGDRIALMREGRIVEDAPPSALFNDPKTPEGAMIFPGSQMLSGSVQDNHLSTSFGPFDATGVADGPGLVVLRHGAVSAALNSEGAFKIVDARFVGPGWAAYVAGELGEALLRVEQADEPRIGASVDLSFNLDRVFIYRNQ